jgi:GxxExxY protein
MNQSKSRDILTERIIGCCFEVHTKLGPGFAEKIYHRALLLTFEEQNLIVETEKTFPIFFKDTKVGFGRLDIVVEHSVILEIKAVTGYMPQLFQYQLLSYLKASGIKTGLLVNFGNQSCDVKRLSV